MFWLLSSVFIKNCSHFTKDYRNNLLYLHPKLNQDRQDQTSSCSGLGYIKTEDIYNHVWLAEKAQAIVYTYTHSLKNYVLTV